MDNELRVTSGTTATISYECSFADNTKKTVTIGNYRTQDIPNNLAANIKTFNSTFETEVEDFTDTFVSPSSAATFNRISGATVTVTQRNVLI